jgi:hypothetical protein
MKKLLPILVLLASCNSQKGEEEAVGNAAADEAAAAAQGVTPGGVDLVALQAKVSRAMAVALPDASTAEYRNLRAGAGGAACGEVATQSKGPLAGVFRPFVVTADGLAVVAEGPAIDWEDPDDFVADAYIRWCASPEELQRLAPQLQGAAANSAATAVPVAEEPDLPLPPVREELPAAAAPPADAVVPASPPPSQRKKAPPPPPQIDSFFNSVDRPQ